MKIKKTYSLRGSSMVEVLIALAITSFCASLGMIIYLNIQKSSLPFFKVKAIELAEFYMQKSLKENDFENKNYTADEFTVKRSVERSESFPDCSRVRILVFDASKKKIFELESLVKESGL